MELENLTVVIIIMQIESLIESLLLPFADNPAGLDPRYTEEFLTVKREIEKISGTDYALVQRLSHKILLEQSKDLRVMGYLLLANSFIYGVAGLVETLRLYEKLLKKFWHGIYPQKLTAKLNAIKWLNNSKLIAYVTGKDSITLNEIEMLQDALSNLNEAIRAEVGENLYILQSLEQWLGAKRKVLQNQGMLKQTETNNEPRILENITSENQVGASVTMIVQWYLQQKLYVQAAAYARAFRWSNLKVPPHENNLTRLPSPRASGIAQLERFLKIESPEIIFQQCEALLLEPSYHFYLDLQKHVCNAAKAMGNEELHNYLQTELKGLLQRLPELLKLQFADHMPFADSATIAWLDELLAEKLPDNEPLPETKTAKFFLSEIKKITGAQPNLAKLLNSALHLPTANPLEEFHKQSAIAKIFLNYKRSELAISILERLFKLTQDFHLSYWDSDLATSLWCEYYQALELYCKKTSGDIRDELLQRMHELKQLICQTNPVKALELFSEKQFTK